ncbi:PREDICTED: uncharacterized protein LOC108561886 [Nicrophorus vespilloides]|uniref:Uncharacterized protein LOC108561886 n=1 Tax=Nicrophorus vespilloides TaxID=110193 RepID=A0ABM1MLP1_NICVS|nr:PREDICTED: uncharacterized protein LOC108561886 [Nicrophorus vespilloides]
MLQMFTKFSRGVVLVRELRRCDVFVREINYFNVNNDWKKVTKEAENIVGYPTSFLNLRWILNDEFASLVGHFRKLIDTNHPLPQIAKDLFFKNDFPSFGLIILLISKAGGVKQIAKDMEMDRTAGIMHGQRVLAEVVEMIRMSFLIHNSVIAVDAKCADENNLNYGNKIALLTGDYLLSKCFHDLAQLNNSEVEELMSSSFRDCAECNFLGALPMKHLHQNNVNYFTESNISIGPYKLQDVLGSYRDEWIFRTILHSGNLLAKACKSSLIYGNHDVHLQNIAYLFGRNLTLAMQAKKDCEEILNASDKINLLSAPVMLYFQKQPQRYDDIQKISDQCDDIHSFKNEVLNCTVIEETREMSMDFAKKAAKNLDDFDDSESKESLLQMIEVLIRQDVKSYFQDAKYLKSKDIVKEAEKIVGYSPSFLNLRWLFSDEIANIAIYLRKLTGTNHPIMKVAKDCLLKNNRNPWGLIVLLVSKLGGLAVGTEVTERDITAGILREQRVLAEITEMMRTSVLIHKGIVLVDEGDESADVLKYGNKIALLSGDYLLSRCYSDLAGLKNQDVVLLFSSALRDLVESEFFKPLPAMPKELNDDMAEDVLESRNLEGVFGNAKNEWILRSLLSGGSLLAKACHGVLMLAGHEKDKQDIAYSFGRHLALGWQAGLEVEEFVYDGKVNVASVPVMLHLFKNPTFYETLMAMDLERIREDVRNGSGIEDAVVLKQEFLRKAIDDLRGFDDCNAKWALESIIVNSL